ncbi:MAG: sensor histidine kinase, partial [bacterium]
MRRRVFLTGFLIGALVLLVCGGLFFALQVPQTFEETYEALHAEALYAAAGLERGGVDFLSALPPVNRVTWIGADGAVLYDSVYPALNSNEGADPEVAAALSKGIGKGVRASPSGQESTVYFALRCGDGTVLRLSRPVAAVQYSLVAVSPVLWVLALVLLLSAAAAYRVTGLILAPVNALDLDDPDPAGVYPELAPLVTRVREQQETIAREAEAREKLRREFTANVSHELRTPLTSISGFAELLAGGVVSPAEAQEFGADIYKESSRMLSLVDDLLRLAKLDEGAGYPEKERVELMSLAQECAESLRSAAAGRGIALTVRGEETAVLGVRQVLHEMLYNLMDNAIKYNRPGGSVTVTAGTETGCPFL